MSGVPQGESRVNENAIYDDGTRVPIGERCEFVRIDPKKHEFIKSHKGPFESGKLLKNSSWLTGDGDDRFFYPDCEVQLDNGEIVKSDFNSSPNVMMPKLLFKVMPKPIDDVFAPKGVPAAAPPQADEQLQEQEQQQLQEQQQQLQEQEQQLQEEPEAKRRKCSEEATFLNAVPSDCIQPGPKPEFHNYMEAAIKLPVDMAVAAGAEMAGDALKATRNRALIEIATAQALGPEQAKQLEIMSEDPKVAAALGNVKANISHAVENSINTLSREIQKPVEEAATKLTTGAITAGTSALASVTGPLVPLATLAGTVGELVNDATQISDAVENATGEVRNAMAQTTELTQALDEAQKNAAAAAASGVAGATNVVASGVAGATNAAASGVADATSGVASGVAGATSGVAGATNVVASGVAGATNVVASGVSNATNVAASGVADATSGVAKAGDAIKPIRTVEEQARDEDEARAAHSAKIDAQLQEAKAAWEARRLQKMDAQPTASTGLKMQSGPGVQAKTITPEKQGIHAGGGSRKRRRIAKLSRRIERTLRRVQKKHGLRDDKNSFLRRTLNAKKMK